MNRIELGRRRNSRPALITTVSISLVICVICVSSTGNSKAYAEVACGLGKHLDERNIVLENGERRFWTMSILVLERVQWIPLLERVWSWVARTGILGGSCCSVDTMMSRRSNR